jgi:hypothetical protein
MNEHIKKIGSKARIFALVHDSILAEVPEDEVDQYIKDLTKFIKLDRGVSIPGYSIGCDFEVADDYSMMGKSGIYTKFEELYEKKNK